MHRAKSLNQECGWKDGDRAAGLERKESTGRREKTLLTHTGLLMEGVEADRNRAKLKAL